MKTRKSMVLFWFIALTLLWIPGKTFGLDVGDNAPLFSGKSTYGTTQLEDYLGKKNVVLALYFAIFTPV
jgi:hypothetical protein